MLHNIFGAYATDLTAIVHFIIGKPHKTMGIAYMLVVINIVIAMLQKKTARMAFGEGFEKLFAYTAFIILGNILDSIAIDNLFEWSGSTQFLICLYLMTREIKITKDYLTQRFGIDIPILNQRISQIEQHAGGQPQDLNTRIDALRQELKDLEQQQNSSLPSPAEEHSEPPGETPVG